MNANTKISLEDRTSFSITELAEEFGVTSRTIRFYEDKDLIRPEREGTTRIYSRSDRGRLKMILRGRRLGFSLQEIKKMLDMYSPEGEATEQLNYTLSKCKEQLSKLIVQREDINEAIAELEDGIGELETYLSSSEKTKKGCHKKLA
jgi:DNA-binding transcriptional MerR regulator